MPCYFRRTAWRVDGGVSFTPPRDQASGKWLLIPCGKCLGCLQSAARAWVIRCALEAQQHKRLCWATLTYDAASCPVTLRKDHLSGFIKRLRARLQERDIRFRFFACGEYGSQRKRPHYHCIFFGLSKDHEADMRAAWGMGIVQVDRLEMPAIAYVAGYTGKNFGAQRSYVVVGRYQELDRETGEITEGWHRNVIVQAPFLLMSRRPGIGSDARRHWRSWKSTAVMDGKEVGVPRYLHEAYKANASAAELEALQASKDEYLQSVTLETFRRDIDGEKRALAKLNLKMQARRKL